MKNIINGPYSSNFSLYNNNSSESSLIKEPNKNINKNNDEYLLTQNRNKINYVS